jgi:hypothetical protein
LANELYQIVEDELFLLGIYTILEVGKSQDLPSKIWQTFGHTIRQCVLH